MVSEHASPLAALGGVDAGGQNVHVAALAVELGRRGVDVVVHTRREEPHTPSRVPLAPRVEVEHVEAGPARLISKDGLLPHMGAFARELRTAWEREPPDVVHAHFWMSGLAALEAARPLGIPVVQTFHALGVVKRRHQGTADPSPPGRLEIEGRIMREADHVVATCSDEVFELARLGADRRRVTVVPCGVDLARFTPEGPAEPRPGVDGGQPPARILAVARLVERKGVGEAVAALADVPGAELVVAGGPDRANLDSDPEVGRLRALADRHDVEDRVDFRGRVARSELPALFRSADVAVCVPWYEPFGIVPLEAMACDVPVVAASVGGLIDTVVDGVTGVHVPPRDPARLAGALRRLLADPALRRELGAAGSRRARDRYGWERVTAATLDVYAEVATRARARASAARRVAPGARTSAAQASGTWRASARVGAGPGRRP
jgi:D-inositol-3-phosphate glycosyltransferase